MNERSARHLRACGLLSRDDDGQAHVTMAALAAYVTARSIDEVRREDDELLAPLGQSVNEKVAVAVAFL